MLQWWSDEDREILKKLYPSTRREEILKALNSSTRKKTWAAIQKEASRLGIKRNAEFARPGRPKKKPKYYVGKRQLKDLLDNTDLTIDEIAKKLCTEEWVVRRAIEKYQL